MAVLVGLRNSLRIHAHNIVKKSSHVAGTPGEPTVRSRATVVNIKFAIACFLVFLALRSSRPLR